MSKSTISMTIFHSKLLNYQGVQIYLPKLLVLGVMFAIRIAIPNGTTEALREPPEFRDDPKAVAKAASIRAWAAFRLLVGISATKISRVIHEIHGGSKKNGKIRIYKQ